MTTEELEQKLNDKFFPGEPLRPVASNINAAFEVLDKLHSQGWFWRLDSVHDGVVCTIQNVKRLTFSIRSPNAPQAILECAIKTLPEELDVTPKEGT